MSLPSSERLPGDINDLPPARQRHIRRQPRSVSLAERQILLDSIIKLTAPTLAFFIRALLGALTLGSALYLQNLALLIVAIVIFPVPAPLFGLALYPPTLKIKHALKALVSLLVLIALVFSAGLVAGVFQTFGYPDPLGLFRFTALYWLDLAIVGISAFISPLILLRQGKNPRELGVLLSYTLLVPFALFGFGLSNGNPALWYGALFVGFEHFGLALLLAVFSFVILGFSPKKPLGWLIVVAALAVFLAVTSIGINYPVRQTQSVPLTVPTVTHPALSSEIPVDPTKPVKTNTVAPTETPIIPTSAATHTPSPSPLITATTTPGTIARWGVVKSDVGVVIRKNPAFDAEIVTYANNGDPVEIFGETTAPNGLRWYQVLTDTGQSGWVLSSLLQIQTTAPAD